MIAILSPSKTLNENPEVRIRDFTIPEYIDEAAVLVDILKKNSSGELQDLMNINHKLAQLNAERYLKWSKPFDPENAYPAILSFRGEVYQGLKAETLDPDELLSAQNHIRILSGLYGLLRPLDLMQPYRLEMGTGLENPAGNDLYSFWGDKLAKSIKRDLSGHDEKIIVNLASKEYFSAIEHYLTDVRIIDLQFKDERNGEFKFITVYGKKARGMMARFMIQNKLSKSEDLKGFDMEGYYYNHDLSEGDNWVFTR